MKQYTLRDVIEELYQAYANRTDPVIATMTFRNSVQYTEYSAYLKLTVGKLSSVFVYHNHKDSSLIMCYNLLIERQWPR